MCAGANADPKELEDFILIYLNWDLLALRVLARLRRASGAAVSSWCIIQLTVHFE